MQGEGKQKEGLARSGFLAPLLSHAEAKRMGVFLWDVRPPLQQHRHTHTGTGDAMIRANGSKMTHQVPRAGETRFYDRNSRAKSERILIHIRKTVELNRRGYSYTSEHSNIVIS